MLREGDFAEIRIKIASARAEKLNELAYNA
jgi:hypothetical protein